jgi:nicotinamidase-related amidase
MGDGLMDTKTLTTPPHFNESKVAEVWRVPYQERALEAREWAQKHGLLPSSLDDFRINLVLVDVQNTFCNPDFELFVSGRSGMGAVEDNIRLCRFIYQNLGRITTITSTLDTHHTFQIFHPLFLVDNEGHNPEPFTLISVEELESRRWRFNPEIAQSLNISPEEGQEHVHRYVKTLAERGKYEMTIWPYHAMLGGVGHALVSSIEEAVFFHSAARFSQPVYEIKGDNPLTEHYSIIGPEVLEGPKGEVIAQRVEDKYIRMLDAYDAVIITGQAKSHCVAWTVSDLLDAINRHDKTLTGKVYILEDCSSPVVIPGVIDYTEQAEGAFQRFAEAGMHLVQSTQPMGYWPGIPS